MQATVKFVSLSDEQAATINATGWDCPTGRAYLEAKFKGEYARALAEGMVVDTARVDAVNAEAVWLALQNGIGGSGANCTIIEQAPRRRSMDVGDLIEWADGRIERCAGMGFEPAKLV